MTVQPVSIQAPFTGCLQFLHLLMEKLDARLVASKGRALQLPYRLDVLFACRSQNTEECLAILTVHTKRPFPLCVVKPVGCNADTHASAWQGISLLQVFYIG